MALDKRKIEEYYQQQIDALNEIVKIQEQQIADKYGQLYPYFSEDNHS